MGPPQLCLACTPIDIGSTYTAQPAIVDPSGQQTDDIPQIISDTSISDWCPVLDIHTSLYRHSPSPSTRIRSSNPFYPEPDTTPEALHVRHGTAQSKLDLDERSQTLQQQLSKLSITPLPSPRKLSSLTPFTPSHQTTKIPTTPSHRITKNTPRTPGAPRKARKHTPLHIRLRTRPTRKFHLESSSKANAGHSKNRSGHRHEEGEVARVKVQGEDEVVAKEEVRALEGERNLAESSDSEIMNWDL